MIFALEVSGNDIAQYVLGVILFLLAIFLVIVVLKQTGKEKGLSGTISGGSTETYFGKAGGNKKEKTLSMLTIIGSVVFVLVAIALTILVTVA